MGSGQAVCPVRAARVAVVCVSLIEVADVVIDVLAVVEAA